LTLKALEQSDLYIDDGELRCASSGPNGAANPMIGCDHRKDQTLTAAASGIGQRHLILLKRAPNMKIARGGIGRKFQKPTIFDALSVFEIWSCHRSNKKVLRYR